MRPFTDADFESEEYRDAWITERTFDLSGRPLELTLSRGTSTTVEQAQIDCLNDLLGNQAPLNVLIEAALVKYRVTLTAAEENESAFPSVSGGDIWRFVKPLLMHIPFHYSSKDRHVFFHFLIDVDGEHGVEIYVKNGKLEGIGPIYCQWQEAGWLSAERKEQQLICSHSVLVPGSSIAVGIPDGWVDNTESYRSYLESWREVVFLRKLDAPTWRRSLPAPASVVFYVASLPEGISLEDFRANLSAVHSIRNQDISFQGYSGFVLESHLSKVMVLNLNSNLFVYQVRALADIDNYRALWSWIPQCEAKSA